LGFSGTSLALLSFPRLPSENDNVLCRFGAPLLDELLAPAPKNFLQLTK
jgi:hypothetical protein